ncbi:hypothetical protein MYK68_10410 [Gordonia sp. PP30]|uniref:hypothetical protein n=1 Tax=unclassified Gordonia (in: high G+C Gram-positive bacteria) TaxID=2657482 RepID=UPI001FFE7A7A|nr:MULTISPECIES: hypothetical protein [unclassified Gordonia (in: high G+C Gram-positive bacteria)]UQE73204.1 hypothetical protein MYK68_10410 [Gordonia sp. PP30]
MSQFLQFYFSLDDSGAAAERQLAETVRLVLSADPDDDPVEPGGPVDEARLAEIMAIAHAAASDGNPLPLDERGDVSVDLGPGATVSAFSDSVPPECPRCHELLTDWDPQDWWDGGEEPTEECPSCGFTAPIGDWHIGSTPYARTDCGLVLVDWPNLEEYGPELHDALLASVGSRPRYVSGHL